MNDSTAVKSGAGLEPAGAETVADRLWRLWREGVRPDVGAFLASAGPLSASQAAAVLRVDQRQRWQAGERVPAEEYLQRRPDVSGDAECALDLIFNEFLIRERLGERPAAEEYVRRFPAYSEVLKDQIELHRAMAAGAGSTAAALPPSSLGTELPETTPARPDGPTLPETFGRYRILKELGRGGMGTVYLAHDTQLDRRVALKVPRFGAEAEGQIQRFQREARIAAAFTHPHLCPVYDVGRTDGVHYLTMPLLAGEPLSAWLKKEGRLSEATAARLAALIARAVHAAHQAGVIHRDLKPANVMVGERGEPVVMDFGLARRFGPLDARTTAPGVLVGTPAYSPPEQVGGDPEAMGPTCDVYSLGVMLYEMLTGRLPFGGALHEVLTQVLTREPEPPSRHRLGLDPRLERVCMTAMAKDPKARFASMDEFADALEECMKPGGPLLEPTAALPGPRARRGRWVAGLLLALAAAITVGVAVWLLWPPPRVVPPLPGDGVVPPPPSGPAATERTADAFQEGSEWEGTYRFIPLNEGDEDGQVQVVVTERTGDHFRGVYTTDAGDYRWEIEGTVKGSKATWGFTKVLREKKPQDVVGKATVEARYEGDEMQAVYQDQDSAARLKLRLKK